MNPLAASSTQNEIAFSPSPILNKPRRYFCADLRLTFYVFGLSIFTMEI